LLFIDEVGSALQIRRGALAVRYPNGVERLHHAPKHGLGCIILAAPASISTEAVQWLAAEHVGLLIATKSLSAFSLFDSEPISRTDKNALLRRRSQFYADPVAVARHIVGLKIEAMFATADATAHLARLIRANIVDDAIAAEAVASGAYWRGRRGFEMRFRDDAPPAWIFFAARGERKPSARSPRFQTSNRHATTPLGAMLNYSYAVALAQTARAIIGLGFDPAFGFLHSDKIGRLSFAYDCLEPLRSRIDDIVFEFAASRTFRRNEFAIEQRSRVRLKPALARDMALRLLKRISFHDYERAVLSVTASFP
jgi:CRISPR-associated endonuclease Cas1